MFQLGDIRLARESELGAAVVGRVRVPAYSAESVVIVLTTIISASTRIGSRFPPVTVIGHRRTFRNSDISGLDTSFSL